MKLRSVLCAILFCLLPALLQAQGPASCTITGTLYQIDGVTPYPNAPLKIVQTVKSGAIIATQDPNTYRREWTVKSNSSGVVTFLARQGAALTLTGKFYGFEYGRVVNVPAASTAQLEDLIILTTVFTTPGQIPYAGPNGVPSALNGNATTTPKVLVSRGNGSVSNAPEYWSIVGATANPTTKTFTVTGAGGGAWGLITGTLGDQSDLQAALNAKASVTHSHSATDIVSSTLNDARLSSNVTLGGNSFSGTGSIVRATNAVLNAGAQVGSFTFTDNPTGNAYQGAKFTMLGNGSFTGKSFYIEHYGSGWEFILNRGTDTNAHIVEWAVPKWFSVRSSSGDAGTPLLSIRENTDAVDLNLRLSRAFKGGEIWPSNTEGGDGNTGPIVSGFETMGLRLGTAYDGGAGLYATRWDLVFPGGSALPYFDQGIRAAQPYLTGGSAVGSVEMLVGSVSTPGTIGFKKPDGSLIGRIGNNSNFLSFETFGGAPLLVDGGYFGLINNPFVSYNAAISKSARVSHDGTYALFAAANQGGGSSGVKLLNDSGLGLSIASTTGNAAFDGDLVVAPSTDRIFGVSGLSSGQQVRFRYGGDSSNEILVAYGAGPIFKTYHGLKITSGTFGGVINPALSVTNGQADKAALEVIGAAGQSQPLAAFRNSGNTLLASVEPDGQVNAPTLKLDPTAFSSLGTPSNGVLKFCFDCAVTSGSDNTCNSGGNGALAFRHNGAWRCFNLQN